MSGVTPFVGVWIETLPWRGAAARTHVTPFVGVWIETIHPLAGFTVFNVTPFVGVWIETKSCANSSESKNSHTLRGCVD